mgnify:CR=1 FL=1
MNKPNNWSRINKRENGRGNGWTEDETRALVRVYFEMLRLQKAGKLGRPTKANPGMVSKSAMVKAFMADHGRTKGSVETKLMNISASMVALKLPVGTGYKPLANRSKGLDDIVASMGFSEAHPSHPKVPEPPKMPEHNVAIGRILGRVLGS